MTCLRKPSEAAPRYGAPILLAMLIGIVAALAAAPIVITLLLIAGRGAFDWVKP